MTDLIVRGALVKSKRPRTMAETADKGRDTKYGTARPKLNRVIEVLNLGENIEWHDRAACRDADPDLFFPERGESTAQAKALCRGCPVREECLGYAVDTGQKFGLWGGVAEKNRQKLRRGESLPKPREPRISAPKPEPKQQPPENPSAYGATVWGEQETPRAPDEPAPYNPETDPTDRIIVLVAESFGVTVENMLGKSKRQPDTLARQVAMTLARTLTGQSLNQIAARFGGRDHSTVLNSIDRVTRTASAFPAFAARVNALADSLR